MSSEVLIIAAHASTGLALFLFGCYCAKRMTDEELCAGKRQQTPCRASSAQVSDQPVN